MDATLLAAIRGGMSGLRPAGPRDAVGNRECAYSFDSPYSAGGLFVNLRTYEGCGSAFVLGDAAKSGCVLYAHQAWRKVPKAASEAEAAAAAGEPTTLGVGVAGGFATEESKYGREEARSLGVVVGGAVRLVALPDDAVPEYVSAAVAAALDADAADANRENAWALADEELKESKYAAGLVQLGPEAGGRAAPLSPDASTWACELSGDKENLWLNLSTGYVGGGRDQSAWGGPKGSNGALRHFEATGKRYPLVVKLGTISATGAEIYSYAPDEDGPVLDAKLADHLAFFGINAMRLEKTEKTTAELEVDANAKFEWSAIAEAGAALTPLTGTGLLGLVNLGNSCYLNSVVHLLASVPEIGRRYHGLRDDDDQAGAAAAALLESSTGGLADDHLAQCAKLFGALRSRRYAKPAAALAEAGAAAPLLGSDDATLAEACKVSPRAFRRLFGKGHPEFATPRQQDAAEYLLHVLDVLGRAEHAALSSGRLEAAAAAADAAGSGEGPPRLEYGPYDPLRAKATQQLFAFAVETKTTCGQTSLVNYKASSHLVLEVPVPKELVPAAAFDDAAAAASDAKRAKLEGAQEERPKPKVDLAACLAKWAADETVDDFLSSATGARGVATRAARLKTCPRYLLLKVNRYYVSESWEAKKLDVLIDVPRSLDLSTLRAPTARPAGEGLLPEDAPAAAAADAAAATTIVPDESILAQLLSMGFDENGCKRACVATKNAGPEAAMEWVFGHMGDPDFALPLDETPGGAAAAATAADDEGPDPAHVAELASLGFTPKQATGALKACDGNKERAADWIFSHLDDLDSAVDAALDASAPPPAAPPADDDLDDGDATYELKGLVSHIGANTACGHYVAHLRDADGNFVIFDDEKVAKSEKPPLMLGYVYLYARK